MLMVATGHTKNIPRPRLRHPPKIDIVLTGIPFFHNTLPKLVKYRVPSPNDYHSKIRTEILRRMMSRMSPDLFSRPQW